MDNKAAIRVPSDHSFSDDLNLAVSIGVIIPNYNMADFLVEAIESCLNQNRKPKEILVIDNASTDDSVERIRNRFGDRVVVIVQPENVGMFENLTIGFRNMKSDFGKILCADDLLHEDALYDIETILKQSPKLPECVSVGVTQVQQHLGDGQNQPRCIGPSSIPELLKSKVPLSLADLCFRVATFNKFGGFGVSDPTKDFSRDAVIAIRFIDRFGIAWTDRKLVFERPHALQNRRLMPRIHQIEEFVNVFREIGVLENATVRKKIDFIVGSHLGSGLIKLLAFENTKYLFEVFECCVRLGIIRWRQLYVVVWYSLQLVLGKLWNRLR